MACRHCCRQIPECRPRGGDGGSCKDRECGPHYQPADQVADYPGERLPAPQSCDPIEGDHDPLSYPSPNPLGGPPPDLTTCPPGEGGESSDQECSGAECHLRAQECVRE